MAKHQVIIVGAGMAGCFLAIALAKKGYNVHIFEKRESLQSILKESGRSFNLTLYYRGIKALKSLNLWESVKQFAEVAEGNVAHFPNQTERFDLFDNTNEVLYTIHRNSLNKALITEAKKYKNISFHFHSTGWAIDKATQTITFEDTKTHKISTIQYDLLIGADGAYSVVRSFLQHGQESDNSLRYSDWGYKEVWISPQKAKQMHLRNHATHTWPRDNSLLLAFPNPDDSFTLMFNLPRTGKESFTSLTSPTIIETYIDTYFPELAPALSEITTTLLHKPLGHFVTVKTSPWHYKDSIVLVGDAAHAVLPFYGQGMCAAFEDCLLLTKLLGLYPKNAEKAFMRYQEARKRNTDILAELSVNNFIELRDKTRSERFILKDRLYTLLNRWFPSLWLPPLYVLIAHRDGSYEEALQKFKKQERIFRYLGMDLALAGIVGGHKVQKYVSSGIKLISHIPPRIRFS